MKKLVIIDGMSVYYRGYYAMGALSTHDGTPTGGVFGFASIALTLVMKIKPDKVVVAWDKSGTSTSKRKEIFADYKSGRVKPPEDFYAQIPLLRGLVEALNWEFLECDNYEADDIIGTLAKQADEEVQWETIIISSDLDMLQIVDTNTKMYRLVKGFSELEEFDVAAVEQKYGILQKQFLDMKALKGDASDNIPGVPGIGEKSAASLLQKYGDLTGMYEHLDEIPGAMGKKLVAGRKSAFMSYELAKIMMDAPVDLAKVRDFELEPEKILPELKKLEFNSLLKKFEQQLGLGREEKIEPTVGRDLPKDILVGADVKKMMHEDADIARRVLGGERFYDLNQAEFLLDPLVRGRELSDATDKYWRQQVGFEKIGRLKRIYAEYDLPLIPVLYKMEKAGILLDRAYFAAMKVEFEGKIKGLLAKIYELAGQEFNVNSPVQLSEILFDKLGLPTKGIKKTTRGYSTGVKELMKLKPEHSIIEILMEYREVAKLLSTYIVPLPNLVGADGRIHTTFTQDVTATGRLSSVNPNLQNIPVRTEEGRRIRAGFVAEKGKCFVSADYAQFELRLAAVLAGDEGLIADFNAGVDIHTKTAADVFGVAMDEVTDLQRRAAKVINFGVLYGMSAKGLADAVGMGLGEAKQFIEDYFAVRKPIRDYLDATLEQAREQGFVETFYGRRRPTPDVKSPNYIVRTGAERAAMNMPIQGTEADLMKRAMILVDKELPEGAKLVLQVHDSLIVECEEGQKEEVEGILRRVMEGVAPELAIKLAVDVVSGQNWGEL